MTPPWALLIIMWALALTSKSAACGVLEWGDNGCNWVRHEGGFGTKNQNWAVRAQFWLAKCGQPVNLVEVILLEWSTLGSKCLEGVVGWSMREAGWGQKTKNWAARAWFWLVKYGQTCFWVERMLLECGTLGLSTGRVQLGDVWEGAGWGQKPKTEPQELHFDLVKCRRAHFQVEETLLGWGMLGLVLWNQEIYI